MAEAPAIIRTPREAWLAERRELVTASDAAAILGEDPRRSALSVYAEKVEGIETPETSRMRRGRRLEPVIAAEYGDDTGRHVGSTDPYRIDRHPDVPWLGATLDRVTFGSTLFPSPADGYGPLELKAVVDRGAAHEWDDGEAPVGFEIQLQIQIACRRTAWGSLCAFVPEVDTVLVRDRLRDDGFLGVALPVLEDFRARLRDRRPPEADGLVGSTQAVRRLWAKADGLTVPLDHEALAMADRWAAATARRMGAAFEEDELENRLRQRIGTATFGALPDGSYLTLKPHGKGRALRRWWPRLRRR